MQQQCTAMALPLITLTQHVCSFLSLVDACCFVVDVCDTAAYLSVMQVAYDGMSLEQVPHEPLLDAERVLCNRCATCIVNLHRHCDVCQWDLCVDCGGDVRSIADGVVYCPNKYCGVTEEAAHQPSAPGTGQSAVDTISHHQAMGPGVEEGHHLDNHQAEQGTEQQPPQPVPAPLEQQQQQQPQGGTAVDEPAIGPALHTGANTETRQDSSGAADKQPVSESAVHVDSIEQGPACDAAANSVSTGAGAGATTPKPARMKLARFRSDAVIAMLRRIVQVGE